MPWCPLFCCKKKDSEKKYKVTTASPAKIVIERSLAVVIESSDAVFSQRRPPTPASKNSALGKELDEEKPEMSDFALPPASFILTPYKKEDSNASPQAASVISMTPARGSITTMFPLLRKLSV